MNNTETQNPKTKPRIFLQAFVMAAVAILFLSGPALSADQKAQLLTELPQAVIPQPFAKAGLTESRLAGARNMLNQGRENLNIIKFGNGVHNKKYSIMLIDAAITHFEDMIEYLEEGQ